VHFIPLRHFLLTLQQFACTGKQGFATLDPTPGRANHLTVNYISKPLAPTFAPYARFNDGACDPRGRFWAGTLRGRGAGGPGNDAPGELWCMGIGDEGTRLAEGGWTDCNGMGWWEEDGKWTYYFTDTGRNKIHAYDYDVETGEISNKRDHIDAKALGLAEDGSGCDGLCIDSEGCIWSARWRGSNVVRYTKDGKGIDLIIEIPGCYLVTMPCFVGKDLDKLFITSASNAKNNNVAEQNLERYPYQGDCFLYDFKGEFKGGDYRWEFTQ